MTRHTRVRQIYKFRGGKVEEVTNEPIKDSEAFYKRTYDLDPSFQKVTLFHLQQTWEKSLLGNYRLQKKLHKHIKEHGGKEPSLMDILDRIKWNPKLKKKYKYLIATDDKGRIYTGKLGRKTIYGFISDYDRNTCVYFDKLGNKYWG